MMYGGKYMKNGNGNGNGYEDDDMDEAMYETEKYNKYGCVGPTTTFAQILATDTGKKAK